MLNKKYIIGGVRILVIIAGAVFFSRNNSSTPDASVLEKGVKNLTRDSAAEMIETFLKVNPLGGFFNSSKTKRFNYNDQLGYYAESYVENSDVQILKNLEAGGFIKILTERNTPYIEDKKDLTFDFTDQAKPYFIKRENATPDNKNVDVFLAKVVNVEVTGITESAVTSGVNTRIANYTVKYEPTPIGKIIDEKQAGEEVKGQMPFVLYDDGWRIEW